MSDQSKLRLASDIGGTFTDVAVFDEASGKLTFGKALSTPQRLVEGINNGVAKTGADYKDAGLFLHGSTIAINTILERKGAKTALIITKGFPTSTKSAASTGLTRTICSSRSMNRWSSVRCALK